MKKWKLFYSFQCPLGAPDSKIGITGHPAVRLGVYQNSYSRNSHIACFNLVYVGPEGAVSKLEKAVKLHYNWDIQRDGRGASEWVAGHTVEMIEQIIDKIIDGHKFKVQKVDKRFLPLTTDNMEEFLEFYELDEN
jgi:hypothetical protein